MTESNDTPVQPDEGDERQHRRIKSFVMRAGRMTERFTELPGTRFTPSARSASGAREFGHPQVDLEGRDSFSWIIVP